MIIQNIIIVVEEIKELVIDCHLIFTLINWILIKLVNNLHPKNKKLKLMNKKKRKTLN